MPRSAEALVEPELLTWARSTAGLDLAEAARKAAVDVDRLANWENGEQRPTIAKLRDLARVYRRPLAAFYLPEPPEDPRPPKDFRRLPGEVAGVESPELRYELRKAIARRDFALELLVANDEEAPVLGLQAQLTDAPEHLGSKIRRYLGVTPREQARWLPPYGAFNAWRDAIEFAGVLVTQLTDVELSEVRGFSISDQPLAVIAVNIKDAPNGRTFSLMHEFVHVILRQGGLCDLEDEEDRPRDLLNVERFCNRTAAEALMPEAAVLASPAVVNHGPNVQWSDSELSQSHVHEGCVVDPSQYRSPDG
ncbi:MAG: XRE family transcriptional regulator [Acidimicrobiales bacterium]|jgi:transcriptional regulator with XRE-family HTH domain